MAARSSTCCANGYSPHEEGLLHQKRRRPFSDLELTIAQLEKISNIRSDELTEFLTKMSFIIESDDQKIRFATDAHRRFVADKLSKLRLEAEGLLISYYEQDPFNNLSIYHLPLLYSRNGKHNALKNLISVNYLIRSLKTERDIGLIHRNVQIVADSSYKTEDWQGLSKFALMSASIRTISGYSVDEIEIDALLSIGEHQKGIEKAYRAVTPVDRLYHAYQAKTAVSAVIRR